MHASSTPRPQQAQAQINFDESDTDLGRLCPGFRIGDAKEKKKKDLNLEGLIKIVMQNSHLLHRRIWWYGAWM